MTRGRYEIEFQGSNDGTNWIAYPFRNKPQALNEAPGIYAPYQPRFDWNLWFASLGDWRRTILSPSRKSGCWSATPMCWRCFASNPFPQAPPRYVRAVIVAVLVYVRWRRSGAPAIGGVGSIWGFTRRS